MTSTQTAAPIFLRAFTPYSSGVLIHLIGAARTGPIDDGQHVIPDVRRPAYATPGEG